MKQHRPAQDSGPGPSATPPLNSSSGGRGNAFAAGMVSRKANGGPANGDAGASFAAATEGAGAALPYQAEMEAAFGEDFSNVEVHLGASGPLADIGASAAAQGEVVTFADANPDKATVAHELTHVVQQRGGSAKDVQFKGGLSNPASGAEREADAVGARVAGGQAAGPVTGQAGGAVHRKNDSVEVDLVEVDTNRKPEDIAEDNLNTIHGILVNYAGALQNFETVVNNSSASEAAPKDAGMIALEEVGKVVFDKLLGAIASVVPGGAAAKAITDTSKGVLEAIAKEKARAQAANESNALKNFVVSQRTQVTTATSSLLAAKTDTREAVAKKAKGLEGAALKSYKLGLGLTNNNLNTALKGSHSVAGLSTTIACQFIENSKKPGSNQNAHIFIRLDKEWKVSSAYIQAPRGDRIGEWLTQVTGQQVKLGDLPCDRILAWSPYGPESVLPEILADYDENGSGKNLRSTMGGQQHIRTFADNIKKKGIPDAVKVTGVQTK